TRRDAIKLWRISARRRRTIGDITMRAAWLHVYRGVRADARQRARSVAAAGTARVVVHADTESLAETGHPRLTARERRRGPPAHTIAAIDDGSGDHRHVARAVLEAPRVRVAVTHLGGAVPVLQLRLPDRLVRGATILEPRDRLGVQAAD